MMSKLADLGLKFDPATQTVSAGEGVDVSNLPSSIALNGASDGQGKFYSDKDFRAKLSDIDSLILATGGDPKKPFQESYDAREKLEKMRVDIETKRCKWELDYQLNHRLAFLLAFFFLIFHASWRRSLRRLRIPLKRPIFSLSFRPFNGRSDPPPKGRNCQGTCTGRTD